MKQTMIISLRMLILMTLLTGVLYPLAVTLICGSLFRQQSEGSFVERNGTIVGSKLIGQQFREEKYFWPRPSAVDYNPLPSSGSNLGPTSDSLRRLTEQRRHDFISSNGLPENTIVPNEMLFASGSGVDPHISPAAAFLQIDRVARARRLTNIARQQLQDLVERSIEHPTFGVFGEPRINVLELNLAIDALH